MVIAIARRIRRRVADERGVTLIELLVGSAISLIVAGVAMTMLNASVSRQPEISERAAQIQQGRVLIERITRELRQGETVSSATSSGLEIVTYVDSATCGGGSSPTAIVCEVLYSCGSTSCTRTEREPNATSGGSTETVVSGILGPNVFSYQPSGSDPTYVGVELRYPDDDGEEAVILSDGVALRNYLEEAGS